MNEQEKKEFEYLRNKCIDLMVSEAAWKTIHDDVFFNIPLVTEVTLNTLPGVYKLWRANFMYMIQLIIVFDPNTQLSDKLSNTQLAKIKAKGYELKEHGFLDVVAPERLISYSYYSYIFELTH